MSLQKQPSKHSDSKRILLLNLPAEGQCADFYTPRYAIDSFSVYPPLGLLYVATAIKDSYPVKIMDTVALNYTIAQTVEAVFNEAPAVLGISCQTFRLFPMIEIIRKIKSRLPDITVVIGGPHTSIYPVETLQLPGVDYVIVGDGEAPFKKLLDVILGREKTDLKNIPGLVYKENGIVFQNERDYHTSIDGIKIPDRSLLDCRYYYTAADEKEQVVTMISSRGCPFQCIFCDVQEKNYRWRSAQSVVDEMEYIAKSFDNPVIHIFDDTFNLIEQRVFEICREIERRDLKVKWTTRARVHPFGEEMVAAMKRAGLKRAHFGVESGSEITLQNIKKGVTREQTVKAFELCRKYQIDSLAYFIIGFDWETKKDINATVAFTKEIGADYIMANTLYPAAKTVIYEGLLKSGKIQKDFWKEFASAPIKDFSLPQYRNKKTLSYLKRKLDETYLTFYLSPDFVLGNLNGKGRKERFSPSRFLFKAKLAFLIIGSYCESCCREWLCRQGINEIQ
ncbi:MAG: radical SAM protein [Candidatus Omnitrophota bacterium]